MSSVRMALALVCEFGLIGLAIAVAVFGGWRWGLFAFFVAVIFWGVPDWIFRRGLEPDSSSKSTHR